jgi:hypothetical protein
MDKKEHKQPFIQRITRIDNRPQIYIAPSSAKEETSTKTSPQEGRKPPISFFGHHIEKLLDPDKAADEDFVSIDKELESSLQTVHNKLRMIKGPSPGESRISEEEIKHRHFIEERNKAQMALFEDIIRFHREFGTGLASEDLLSLHELIQMEAAHEKTCSLEKSVHELVECNLLTFLRRKAAEQAWRKLEGYIGQLHMPFPIPPTMLDPAEPVRNEKVREEQKRKAQEDFLTMPAQDLAELILGNVPAWVYYYPQKGTYLWQLTVLQALAAGLAGNLLMKYLSVWEENSSDILNKIQQEFAEKIDDLRRRGQSTISLPEVLSISKELERISREQMPEEVWKYICSELDVTEQSHL